ncbi:MAG: hypothetical protein RBS80_06660 [Thermoguttaceae bacterium]|jgi:hypothetical protein|nr:hypothetical protein [Thermoguttaceae bacterium]
MKRIALALAVVAVLAVGAARAQAHPPRHYRGGPPPRSHYYAPPRHYGPRVVYPPPRRPYYGPAVVVPAPVYPYPYYYGPSSGFYYRGSGISIGIGF